MSLRDVTPEEMEAAGWPVVDGARTLIAEPASFDDAVAALRRANGKVPAPLPGLVTVLGEFESTSEGWTRYTISP